MMIIVDTNVIIDIERGKDNVKRSISQYPDEIFSISLISVVELFDGVGYTKSKLGEDFSNKKATNLRKILSDFSILPLNRDLMELVGLKQGELRSKGFIFDLEDIIIGISGEKYNANLLITRNKKHFKHFSIPIESYLK